MIENGKKEQLSSTFYGSSIQEFYSYSVAVNNYDSE